MSEMNLSPDEIWEERKLGFDERYVELADSNTEKEIDEAACTKLISIRVQKSLIDDMRLIAALNKGIGYQTLMKQVLHRFVDCEKKRLFRKLASEKLAALGESKDKKPPRPRKSA